MSLLDPESRSLYTDALRPPPGMAFDVGVGTTYSLDLDTLLTVPLHLLLYSGEEAQEELLGSVVALLRALRSISSRLTVYCERGRIHEPDGERRLYGLLEKIAVPVEPPSRHGSFHPKLWLLRFRDPEDGRRHLRLLILSRNLTRDLSWDLMLRLEGMPGEEPVGENDPLAGLLQKLRDKHEDVRAHPDPDGSGEPRGSEEGSPGLLHDLRRTEWTLPDGFDELRFHVTGPDRGGWVPEGSDRLFVASPFCSTAALERLAETTGEARGLVSRPEELVELGEPELRAFTDVFELDEMAVRGAGAGEEDGTSPRGLHAKLYVTENGGRTRLHVGSANATRTALLDGRNVEVMAELVGPADRVGDIDTLLDPEDGVRRLLREWVPPDEPPEPDEETREARDRLERARRRLPGGDLRLDCREQGGEWRLHLVADGALDLEGVGACRTWPVTVARDRAVDAGPLARGDDVVLAGTDLTSLTTFIAFRLVDGPTEEELTFVLSLPVKGLPREERDAALVRHIIRDREGFLRYLLMLLGEVEEDAIFGDGDGAWGKPFRTRAAGAGDELPLLEELTRAYCRDPERLEEVGELIEDLRDLAERRSGDEKQDEVIPDEFLTLWSTFEEVLQAKEGEER